MGALRNVFEGFVNGFVSAGADRLRNGTAQNAGGRGLARIDELCRELGWTVDERFEKGVVLHFNDPLLGIRKLLVNVGDAGLIGALWVPSAAKLREAPPQVLAHLLQRNCHLFGAWQMTAGDDGVYTFALAVGLVLPGLDAPVFKTLCEQLVKEAHDFDAKLRQAGAL